MMDGLATATIEAVRGEVRRLVEVCKPLCPDLTRDDVLEWLALRPHERQARGYDSWTLHLIEASLWLAKRGPVEEGRWLVRMWPAWMACAAQVEEAGCRMQDAEGPPSAGDKEDGNAITA